MIEAERALGSARVLCVPVQTLDGVLREDRRVALELRVVLHGLEPGTGHHRFDDLLAALHHVRGPDHRAGHHLEARTATRTHVQSHAMPPGSIKEDERGQS